ncbi:hypothetical protein Hte_004730 [Hypoxylon texense]
MSSPSEAFAGRMYCIDHNRLTCSVCLHSINSVEGFIPTPDSDPRFPCPESAHSVEPVFEYFKPTISSCGYHSGLSPQQRQMYKADDREPQLAFNKVAGKFIDCKQCGLTYYMQGGLGYADIHPSHVSADGKRYVVTTVEPSKFERQLDRLLCDVHFWFGHDNPKLNSNYECAVRPDYGTVDWNIDNAQISAIVQLFQLIECRVIPYRRKLIEDNIYTNSEYFAGQSWRFQLVVCTMLSQDTLDLLLRVHKLKYSKSRKAFVERNALGIISKKYPMTEERRHQIVYFLRMVKYLANEYGIQVFWYRVEPSETFLAARKAFMDEPSQMPRVSSGEIFQEYQRGVDLDPNEARYVVEGDLLEGDSMDALSAHEGFGAVEQPGGGLDDHDYFSSHPDTFHFN